MRLILLNLILLCYSGLAWGQVTVCPSGCNVTTIASAQQTATATPNSVISLNSSVTENAAISGYNTSLTFIQTTPTTYWTSNGAGVAVSISGGSGSVTFNSISFTPNTSSITSSVRIGSTATSSKIYFLKDIFNQGESGTSYNCIRDDRVLTTSNEIVIDSCLFNGAGSTSSSEGCLIDGATTTASTINIKNSIFYGWTGSSAAGLKLQATSSNILATIDHCDFYNNATSSTQECGTSTTNCIFSGNTAGPNISNGASNSNFSFCIFDQFNFNSGGGGFGTGCIFKPNVASQIFVNPGTDFHLLPCSLARLTGTNTGLATDISGTSFLNPPSMGAYEVRGSDCERRGF